MKHQKYMKLYEALAATGATPYVVGGYVRDMLLGRNPNDVDIVVVGGDPFHGEGIDILEDMLPDAKIKLVGNDFPVYLVDGIEVAYARTERKTGEGYTGFSCEVKNVTLEQDLYRRDLAINSMALDPFTDKIIDPYNGIEDIQNNVLTPTGPHFGEDPLRVLRAARFAAQLEMTIGEALVTESQKVLHELNTLPGERIWGEIEKALRTSQPSRFFKALDKLGALEIVLPEIAALKGRIQPEKYHPEGDAYVHTLLVIDEAARLGADDETMFAALVHDLGKAVTDDDNLPHHYNHEALGVPLVHKMCERLRVPASHRKTGMTAAKEHLNVHRFNELKPVKKVRLLMRLGVVQDDSLARRVMLAAKADARGRGPLYANVAYEQGDRLLEAAAIVRQVKGHQFANLKDGHKISVKMEQARTKALQEAGF